MKLTKQEQERLRVVVENLRQAATQAHLAADSIFLRQNNTAQGRVTAILLYSVARGCDADLHDVETLLATSK